MALMRVAVFDAPGSPLRIEARALPTPGSGQVLLRVQRCGVCGSDLYWTKAHARAASAGTVLGHEFSGEVVALGSQVSSVAVGDRVCALPFNGCGVCADCRAGAPYWCVRKLSTWGGYGEYTVVAAAGCVRLPEPLSWDDGALVEPLSSGLHAVRLAQGQTGASALVIGAGAIGLSCVYWLRRLGAGTITVVARTDRRRAIAAEMGADAFIAASGAALEEAVRTLPATPAAVFECSGATGMGARAMQWVRSRGTVLIAGMQPEPDALHSTLGVAKELRIQYVGPYDLSEFRETVAALASGDTTPRRMITGVVSLDAFPQAFEALRIGGDQCKLLVNPWGGGEVGAGI